MPFSGLGGSARCGACKSELGAIARPVEIEGDSFFESLIEQSSLPVLVDFWADWCGPCKMMAPELERLAAKSAGRYLVAKLNTEGVPSLAQRFNISAIPSLVLFAGGKEVARTQGAQPAAQVQRFIEQALRVG